MPACRQMSLTGTPASACLRIETIWVSVKRDFFMQPPGWGKHARKFYLWGVCGSGKLTPLAIVSIPLGILIDHVNRVRILSCACIMLVLGTAATAIADNYYTILFARA